MTRFSLEATSSESPSLGPATSLTTTTLSESYRNEISEAFDIFDEERTGLISINAFKILIRALGFRATRTDVLKHAHEAKARRRTQIISDEANLSWRRIVDSHDDGDDDESDNEVDLELVQDIIKQKYSNRDAKAEISKMFRLFDVDRTGYITLDNLRQVVQGLNDTASSQEMKDVQNRLISSLGELQLKAMIEEFDRDLDDVISEDEFRCIMELYDEDVM